MWDVGWNTGARGSGCRRLGLDAVSSPMPGGKGGPCGTGWAQSPQGQASRTPCPLTLVVLLLQPAAGQLQGQGSIEPLVLSFQAKRQRWPPFLQGFQLWA